MDQKPVPPPPPPPPSLALSLSSPVFDKYDHSIPYWYVIYEEEERRGEERRRGGRRRGGGEEERRGGEEGRMRGEELTVGSRVRLVLMRQLNAVEEQRKTSK